jgi:hypothetical protein
MVLKGIFAALVCTVLLAWSGPSTADEYRPDEFLKLDLSQAALSPKLLGPSAQFEPVAVEARESKEADPVVTVAPVRTVTRMRTVTPVRTVKRHIAVQTKLVRRHTNPLDAQAFDTRIQVWPCRSGGICNWQR